ncbi:MAG: chloride channel protein [Sulfurimonas sp.]|nr:chloride channel protein [Sulfurimonas sp.]
MKKHIVEQTVLLASVTKWVILSSIIGALSGALVAAFLGILSYSQESRSFLGFPYYYTLPFALALTVFLVKKFAPEAEGHGTEKVIEAIHKHSGKMKVVTIPIKLAATTLTIFAGGSVGKEGPAAQIGAAASSLFASIFSFNDRDRKKLVVCGIGAGFAAVFGTPIAGAIFGVEVLVIGVIMYDVLLPSIIAGFSAFMVARALGVEYSYFEIVNYKYIGLDWEILLDVMLAGIFFGAISVIFIVLLHKIHKFIKSIKLNPILKAFIGGLIIVILTMIFSDVYLGLGFDTIKNSLNTDKFIYDTIAWYDFILKMIFTALTLGSGGSGGIITPIFYIGATSGNFFGHIIDGNIPFFAALGFISLLAGTTNAPIASIIMAMELFGIELAQYAALTSIIAYLITGHRSVFSSQILFLKKSDHLDIELGQEIDKTEVNFTHDFKFKKMQNMKDILEDKKKRFRERNKRVK